jgi:hypothetical protein
MPERHSIIELKIAHYRAMLKSDLCDEKRAQVKRWLAARLADLNRAAGAKQPTRDHAGTRATQVMERLDRIDDELNAGPRRKGHIVTSRGEFLDDFESSVEAGDWQTRRATLVNERRLLTAEWESLADADENRP